MKRTSLEKVFVHEGIINENQLQEALIEQHTSGKTLQSIVVHHGWAQEKDLLDVISRSFNIPLADLSPGNIDISAVQRISAKVAYKYKLFPMKQVGNELVVATANPFDIHAFDDIRLLTECDIKPALCTEKDIVKILKSVYGVGAETMDQMVASGLGAGGVSVEEKSAENDTGDDASVISFVNQVIREAYNDRATDIHIEPFEDDLIIRYRIDGVLHSVPTPPAIKDFQSSIVSRIKIMADMNIAEKRLPQDGRIRFKVENDMIDLRVSTLPILHGESIDLRILPRSQMLMGLENLGLPADNLATIERLIQRPHGILLVTGPTGNGKTTTLYACLTRINSPEKKIITVEDPVEYQIKGINQIPVHARIGLTFANGLRSILRQDPDVIMIGEIRDQETAEIAIRASLTGHLVFSTLHTNDAPGALTRLIDMNIEPYLVSSSIEAVLAQRLVRIVCPTCRIESKPTHELLDRLSFVLPDGVPVFNAGSGCDDCRHTGYRGRTGIYELLIMDEEMRRIALEKTSTGNIRKEALLKGMRSLRQDGWSKVVAGVTTIDEVIRVTQEEEIL